MCTINLDTVITILNLILYIFLIAIMTWYLIDDIKEEITERHLTNKMISLRKIVFQKAYIPLYIIILYIITLVVLTGFKLTI